MDRKNRLLSWASVLLFSLMILNIRAHENPVGFGNKTTGGWGGDSIIVTNRSELIKALDISSPRVILVKDTIDLVFGESVQIFNDSISIVGFDENAMLRFGGLKLYGNNIIVRNLSIGKSYTYGRWDGKGEPYTDAITVYGKNIWIDHCDLFQSHDGLIDFSDHNNECADFVTVSWTRFSNHNKVMLVGSNDQSTLCRDRFHITIHHCWFDGTTSFYDTVTHKEYRAQQRMPRVRFGDVHVFNCYYERLADYGIAARMESKIVAEKNYFRNFEDPHLIDDVGKGITDPELRAVDNIYDNVKGDRSVSGKAFYPSDSYDYIPDNPELLPEIIMNGAGKYKRMQNQPPVALNDTIILSSPEKFIEIFPLKNDTDPDGDPLRISSAMSKNNNNIKVYTDILEYLPSLNADDVIEYKIIDYEGGSCKAKIIICYK